MNGCEQGVMLKGWTFELGLGGICGCDIGTTERRSGGPKGRPHHWRTFQPFHRAGLRDFTHETWSPHCDGPRASLWRSKDEACPGHWRSQCLAFLSQHPCKHCQSIKPTSNMVHRITSDPRPRRPASQAMAKPGQIAKPRPWRLRGANRTWPN